MTETEEFTMQGSDDSDFDLTPASVPASPPSPKRPAAPAPRKPAAPPAGKAPAPSAASAKPPLKPAPTANGQVAKPAAPAAAKPPARPAAKPPAKASASTAATQPPKPATKLLTKQQAAAGAAKPSTAPAPAAAPGKINTIGDYRLIKKLGQGGMGTVYKAFQISMEREVALKVLARELVNKSDFVQRFLREGRVMAKLDHPNILRCFDVGQVGTWHYLSMEFVEGGSVEGWVRKLGKLNVGDAAHIIIAAAKGLQHAHDLGMIHRDVKPDNILLTAKGVVKVADLGLAKATDDDLSLTKTGTGAGTPLYMAPEQARDVKRVDNRSDIYALGCMFYCLLTGEVPYKGETLIDVLDAKMKGKHTPARRTNPDVPNKLELIIDKMIAYKPEHRYQSCAEVVDALEELGLASEQLSFMAGAGAAKAAPKAPAKKGMTQLSSVLNKTTKLASKADKANFVLEPEVVEDKFWYVQLKTKDKQITKKVTPEQLQTMLKSGSLTSDTQISQELKGKYRAIATYPEFQAIVRAQATKEKADRKGAKYRDMYQQIEAEDARRRRWAGLRKFVKKFGFWMSGILWLCVVAALLVGAFFLVRYLLDEYGEGILF